MAKPYPYMPTFREFCEDPEYSITIVRVYEDGKGFKRTLHYDFHSLTALLLDEWELPAGSFRINRPLTVELGRREREGHWDPVRVVTPSVTSGGL